MEKIKMEKIEEYILRESFKEVIETLNDNDLELVEAYHLDKQATDSLDCVNQLVFRSYNSNIKTEQDALDLIKEFEDPCEYASFKVVKIEDVFIVFIYI